MSGGVKYSPLSQTGEDGDHPVSPSPQSTLVWRGVNILMSVFFLLAALVQVNDPDPYIWMPVYVLPAILTLSISIHPLVTMETWWRVLAVIHIALCLSGSIYLTGVLFDLLSENINNPLIHEEGRELAGLIVIMIWLGLCRFTTLGNNQPKKGSLSALLLVAAVMGLMPLAFWGLCFVDSFTDHLSHCKDMFKGGIFSRYGPDSS